MIVTRDRLQIELENLFEIINKHFRKIERRIKKIEEKLCEA